MLETQTAYARNIAGSTDRETAAALLTDLRHLRTALSTEEKREYRHLHHLPHDAYLATFLNTETNELTLYPFPENKNRWDEACDPIYGDRITCPLDMLDTPEGAAQVEDNYLHLAVMTATMLAN